MELYRIALYILLCIVLYNGQNLADSTPTRQSRTTKIPNSVQTRRISGSTKNKDFADFRALKPKPLKPPDTSVLESDPYGHVSNFSLIKVNIENKRTSDKITYEYNSKTNTHSFIANTGFLFDGAEEDSRTLWECKPGEYADRINITESSDDKRFIKVFIPKEAETEESEIEYDCQSELKLPKIYDPKKTSRGVFMYDTEDEYADMSEQAKASEKPKPVSSLDFEIQEIKPGSKRLPEHENELKFLRASEVKHIQPEPEQLSAPILATLDVKVKETTATVRYEYDDDTGTHTFTPNPGFLIGTVVKGTHQMWVCGDGVYPEKVLVFPDQSGEMMLRVQFPRPPQPQSDSDFEFVSRSHSGRVVVPTARAYDPTPRPIPMDRFLFQGPVQVTPETSTYTLEVDQVHYPQDSSPFRIGEHTSTVPSFEPVYTESEVPQQKIPVDLTIDFRWNTFLFDYSKLNNVATYTAKEGYAFGKVKLFRGYYSRGSDLVLWETEVPEKFANKVVVIEHSKIILYLDNATTVVFKKGYNNLWIEDGYTFHGSALDWDYQYIRLDITHRRTTEVYKVIRHYHDSRITEHLYVPKNGYKFSVVKHADEIVWAITDQNRYSTKVSVLRFSNLFIEVVIGLVDGTTLIFIKTSSGDFKRINF
nr:hypothetical protein MACL_00001896 [Theileria orientalis]